MKLKTVNQVADELLVSRNTVVSLITKNKLTALKVGGQYRIPESSFRAFVSNVTIAPPFKKTDKKEPGVDMLKPDNSWEEDYQDVPK